MNSSADEYHRIYFKAQEQQIIEPEAQIMFRRIIPVSFKSFKVSGCEKDLHTCSFLLDDEVLDAGYINKL